MDHVCIHPKFLHSNATSHKWALGAIAELLDNALDEAPHGATFVNINVLKNPVDGSPMLLFEGITQDRLRECMSFGYTEKDKDNYVCNSTPWIFNASEHIDVQRFNVYHKNWLIKPFWRIWNSSGSQGRGVIGIFLTFFANAKKVLVNIRLFCHFTFFTQG
ncbi:protein MICRORCHIDIA 4 [Selaginella moellendorffii]|uniref:protein MICRORCHIDIA 4 n=1 Tax=Selaginella moellendorffii TaxID=88036 RepID=UPI000D1CD173|nr:protein MICRORCHIDIA 4 [Selaginella moellendorffii]|eukprot:XP_024521937.1 protein MICRORCHIDIA 4 [Selaginella moellendorffii]